MGNGYGFDEIKYNSKIKVELVTKFFSIYSKIINTQSEFSYFDFFSGPGKYDTGDKSTPLIILDVMTRNKSKVNQIIFNDHSKENIELLESYVSDGRYDELRQKIKLLNKDIIEIDYESYCKDIPIFSFVDPFGYKGVTGKLIIELTEPWGSDCILFFNFNRIRNAVKGDNPLVKHHMDQLFGKYKLIAYQELNRTNTTNRQKEIILKYFSEHINSECERYVYPIEFPFETRNDTSHFIILISKSLFAASKLMDIVKNLDGVEIDSSNQAVVKSNQPIQLSIFDLNVIDNSFDLVESLRSLLSSLPDEEYHINDSPQRNSIMLELLKHMSRNNSNIVPHIEKKCLKEAVSQLVDEGVLVFKEPTRKKVTYKCKLKKA